MKRLLPWIAVIAIAVTGCMSPVTESGGSDDASFRAASSAGIRGVNWADGRDNFQSGWVIPSGLSASDSYSSALSKTKAIATNLKNLTGANTIRLPVNPPTVAEWWGTYKATVDGALQSGMKVIVCCWTESHGAGTVTDSSKFYAMWDTVINAYGSNGNVYFEILNEPYGYSKDSWLNLCGQWLSRYGSVPRSRVLVAGTGYSERVAEVGGDSRVSGCLFSQHLYAYWMTKNSMSAWYDEIAARVGPYSSSTVLTEIGCTMTSGLNFYGTVTTNNEVCYLQGMCNYARDKNVGLVYWPGLRDGDSYSLTGRSNGGTSLYVNNASGVQELRWAWRL